MGVRGPAWSSSEIEALVRYYPDRRRLSRLLPTRSWDAIKFQAFKRGLQARKERRWLDREVAYVRATSGHMSCVEIARVLKRSEGAIRFKRYSLGLTSRKAPAQGQQWQLIADIRDALPELGISAKRAGQLVGNRALLYGQKSKNTSRPAALELAALLGAEIYVEWPD